ncbi:hypothetical protein DFH28DRAFT_1079909 [Melampsora americana]|nr:hypothetical protein DFH28DRAFT_1088415 [Melampsora americana]KAH9820016.1 hypothetical protein DFH28DRAFT_1079909 [Melampsora americana]
MHMLMSGLVKLKTAENRLYLASQTLESLESQDPSFTYGYFSDQWKRQREVQLAAIEERGVQEKLEEYLVKLLDLEEQVKDAQNELSRLRRKRRRNRTEAEMDQFLTLPSSIVSLEKAVADINLELGSPEFNQLRAATGPKAEALIRVRLAKMKLYEAKVGIVEAQKKWDKGGQGKSKKLPFEDIFWNVGALSHPTEKWAVDQPTIEGIQAFLQHRSCGEELQRIGRETQQMVYEALKTEEKLDGLLELCSSDYDPEEGGRQLIELVQPGQRISKDVWQVNVAVLRSLHDDLRQKHCRTWMIWDADIVGLLGRTYQHTKSTEQHINSLIQRWEGLVSRGKTTWERIVKAQNIEATALDELEMFEQYMVNAEDDIGQVGDLADEMNQLFIHDEENDSDMEEDLDESGLN